MRKGILRIVERGFPYTPPGAILGASLFNLTTFQRQFLMLVLLIWVSVFFLVRAWSPQ